MRSTVKYRDLGMGKIQTADAGGREHGEVLGERDMGVALGGQQIKQGPFLGMIGAGRVAGGRADAAILLVDQFLGREVLLAAVSPVAPRCWCSISAKASARRSASDLTRIDP